MRGVNTQAIRLFQPETILKWRRELVRRKWAFQRQRAGGRPRTNRELESLIVRLARENRDWGNNKIQGELGKLGHVVSDETIATILRRHGIPPAPERGGSPSWRNLMNRYKHQIPAWGFFTVETLFLKTLIFNAVHLRRVLRE